MHRQYVGTSEDNWYGQGPNLRGGKKHQKYPKPIMPQGTRRMDTSPCLRTLLTASGPDDISVRSLKLAWPAIASRLLQLLQASLDISHYPIPFKHATMVVLPKDGDRDKSHPRSYRPISLLSVLGKGLERFSRSPHGISFPPAPRGRSSAIWCPPTTRCH